MTDIELKLISRILSGELTPLSELTDEERFAVRLMRSERRLFATERNTFVIPDRTRREYLELKQQLERDIAERARKEAERMSDRAYADENTKKQFRHNWRIAIFEVVGSFLLGAIADHFFDIVGNAVRLWLALSHVFSH